MLTLSKGNLKSRELSPPFSLAQDFGSIDKWLKVYVSYSGLVLEGQRINNRFEKPTSNTENGFMFVPCLTLPPRVLKFSVIFVQDL